MFRKAMHQNLGKKGIGKAVKTKLWSPFVIGLSSAATALASATTYALNSTNFPEITNWQAVYDEMRILGVRLHFRFYTATASSSSNPALCFAAIVFDDTFGTPSTSNALMETQWHSKPTLTFPSLGVNTVDNPTLSVLHATPPEPLALLTSNSIVGRSWFTLNNTDIANTCRVAFYGTPLGAAGVLGVAFYVELDVEFRVRV